MLVFALTRSPAPADIQKFAEIDWNRVSYFQKRKKRKEKKTKIWFTPNLVTQDTNGELMSFDDFAGGIFEMVDLW